MNLPPLNRSATYPLQALLSGRVLDSLTSAPPTGGLDVRLLDLDEGEAYPLAGQVFTDGGFVFYGLPERAFPLLETKAYHLRIEAQAPRYETTAIDIDLGPAAGQPTPTARPVPLPDIPDMLVTLFTGGGLPRENLDIMLARQPVRLRGVISQSNDPNQAIENANVTVTPPSVTVTTDAAGVFELPAPLPLVLAVSVEVSAAGFETANLTYELNYNQPVNTLRIGLKAAA